MPTYTQENRIIALQTPLGDDVLLLDRLAGHEGISRLFTFYLDLLSESSSIDFSGIIGKRVTITIHLPGGHNRYVNGFISRFVQSGRDNRFTHYKAEVVPWLWFLTRSANCKIFQKKTIPEILEKMFEHVPFKDFKNKLQGSYDQCEYVVQYRETDFNFVSRLMEQHGIFYYFEHEVNKHTLVFADAPSAHQPCPNQASARFETVGRVLDEERITGFELAKEIRPGSYAMNDYNFETPNTDLDVAEPTVISIANNSSFQVYDFPGEYLNKSSGEQVAKLRMQEEEAAHEIARGVSNCGAFLPGYRFDLQEHYRRDLNKSYVLTEIQHFANCGSAYYTGQGHEEDTYTNHFSCIPYSVPYRPPRITPRPFMQGPQTAVVVGPSGEEIYTDSYGRIKVQFFWDRDGKSNENSSCWIRVSQTTAGKGWGAVNLPRVGQEVVVDFLEGNPDRPIVVGRVYNADQTIPYSLPDKKTTSTMKSYSSKGGGGFNEIRLDDTKGQEQIFINGEYNLDLRVGHDLMETVGNDMHLTVGHDYREDIGGQKHVNVADNEMTAVGGSRSLSVGGSDHETIGGAYALRSGSTIHLTAGQNLIVDAGSTISLKAAGGFINIGPTGVSIVGTTVLINSGGAHTPGPGANPTKPKKPKLADVANPGQASGPPLVISAPPLPPGNAVASSYTAQTLKAAAQSGAPFCDI